MIKAMSVNKYLNTWHLIGQRHSWEQIKKYVKKPFNMDVLHSTSGRWYSIIRLIKRGYCYTHHLSFFPRVYITSPGHIFIRRTDVLPQDLAKPRTREIRDKTVQIALPICLSHFRAIRSLWHPIWRLRDFERFGCKTSYCLVYKGSACI